MSVVWGTEMELNQISNVKRLISPIRRISLSSLTSYATIGELEKLIENYPKSIIRSTEEHNDPVFERTYPLLSERYPEIESMRVSSYNKSLDNLPTSNEYGCCTFLGGKEEDIFRYLIDPDVQLIQIELLNKDDRVKKKAMVIIVDTVYKGEDETYLEEDWPQRKVRTLLVDSIESDHNNIFKDRNIVNLVCEGINDYARENDFEEIFYLKSDWPNRSYQDFSSHLERSFRNSESLNSLEGMGFEEVKANEDNIAFYLETSREQVKDMRRDYHIGRCLSKRFHEKDFSTDDEANITSLAAKFENFTKNKGYRRQVF